MAPSDQAIKVRCAMRAFPGLAGLLRHQVGDPSSCELPLFVASVRAIFVSFTSLLYEGVEARTTLEAAAELDRAVLPFDEWLPSIVLNDWFHPAHVSSIRDGLSTARHALGLASEAVGGNTKAVFDLPRTLDGNVPFDTLPLSNFHGERSRWKSIQQAASEADHRALEAGTSPRKLLLSPLWHDREAEAWELEVSWWLGWTFIDRNVHGPGTFNRLMRERVPGALVLGRPPEAAREIMVRTANLPNAFWVGRNAEDVMQGFSYALGGQLRNPEWGAIKPNNHRLWREDREAADKRDREELRRLRQESSRSAD